METEGFGWILFELNSDWRDLRMEPEGFDQILFDVICRFASIFFSNTLPISLPQILPFTILIQINPATVSS